MNSILGNEYATEKGLAPRLEITGHLHNRAALNDPNIKEYEVALDPLNADPTNPRWIGRTSGRIACDG